MASRRVASQRLCVSANHGFTKLRREKYDKYKKEGRLAKDGVTVQVIPTKGPLGERELSKLPLSMLGGEAAEEEEE